MRPDAGANLVNRSTKPKPGDAGSAFPRVNPHQLSHSHSTETALHCRQALQSSINESRSAYRRPALVEDIGILDRRLKVGAASYSKPLVTPLGASATQCTA